MLGKGFTTSATSPALMGFCFVLILILRQGLATTFTEVGLKPPDLAASGVAEIISVHHHTWLRVDVHNGYAGLYKAA
jgi:hypothetical protein